MIYGNTIGVIKGDTRSLDNGSSRTPKLGLGMRVLVIFACASLKGDSTSDRICPKLQS